MGARERFEARAEVGRREEFNGRLKGVRPCGEAVANLCFVRQVEGFDILNRLQTRGAGRCEDGGA